MVGNSINCVAEWIRIFNQVLGWTPYQTMLWIERNDLERGLDEFIGHEAPLYWAIPEFIPIKLRRELDVKEILSLQHDIWQLYLRGTSNGKRNTDYTAFCDELNGYLLSNYGVELDVPVNV